MATANPYPEGSRRDNACMMLWMRLPNTAGQPTGWALMDPVSIGLCEFLPVKTRRERLATDLIVGLARRENWQYQGEHSRFRFNSGMTIGAILDLFGVK